MPNLVETLQHLMTRLENGEYNQISKEMLLSAQQKRIAAKQKLEAVLAGAGIRVDVEHAVFGDLHVAKAVCWHCHRLPEEHTAMHQRKKCLFEPTYYEAAGFGRLHKLYEACFAKDPILASVFAADPRKPHAP